MLKLAYPYRSQLEYKRAAIAYDERYKYVYGSWLTVDPELDKETWNNLQFVSLDSKADDVIGYFSAAIDREIPRAYRLVAMNFASPSNPVFAADFCRFFLGLLIRFQMKQLNWQVTLGNSAEYMYDKFIHRYGGRIVGVQYNQVKLWDGTICANKLYEVNKDQLKPEAFLLFERLGWQ